MTEEDPDLLAGDNLDDLRGRNRYSPMSERFRLTEELEIVKREDWTPEQEQLFKDYTQRNTQ